MRRRKDGATREANAETEAPTARIASVVLTAKRDICFNPDVPCDPACCRYARGYYDRMRPARDALLGMGLATREGIERTAEASRRLSVRNSASTPLPGRMW